MDVIQVGGLDIAFERQGTGPPLILLHGFVGHSREWRRQIDDLSDEFTVVAWDAPGAGRSSDPPETFRLPDYVAVEWKPDLRPSAPEADTLSTELQARGFVLA